VEVKGVISMEDWVTIRNLKKHNPSLGTRKIAELLGISRNTVKRALNNEVYPSYQRKKKVYEKLNPFHEFIKESYLIKKQRISVIISNLRSKGYEGSDIAVYRYISDHFQEIRNSMKSKSYQPYETAPGEQMQYDWSEYKVKFGKEEIKVYLHSLVYGFSRIKILNASLDISQATILTVLSEGFSELGGVCKRIQVDNAKQLVSSASKNNFKWNDTFFNFCGYYGIEPTRSRPYYPQSKGKVENSFLFIENHFIKNNVFESFDDFYKKLKQFQAEFNNRYHSVIKTTPIQLFEKEKEFLLKLSEEDISFICPDVRKVTSDCLISYNGNRYSVPYHFAGKEVFVRCYKGLKLQVYSQGKRLIAEHEVSTSKGDVIINKAHYKNFNTEEQKSFDSLKKRYIEKFSEFEDRTLFLERLKSQKKVNPSYHLKQILYIFEYYSNPYCIKVMKNCIKYNTFSYHFVKSLIQEYSIKEDVLNTVEIEIPSVDVKRPLLEYKYE
jgi:transposase